MFRIFKKRDIDPDVFNAVESSSVSLTEDEVAIMFIIVTHDVKNVHNVSLTRYIMGAFVDRSKLSRDGKLAEVMAQVTVLSDKILNDWKTSGLIKVGRGNGNFDITKKGWQVRQLNVLKRNMRGSIYDRMKDFVG